MPEILHKGLPCALLRHLRDTNPEVPDGRWFKRFPQMTVCGEGVYVDELPHELRHLVVTQIFHFSPRLPCQPCLESAGL